MKIIMVMGEFVQLRATLSLWIVSEIFSISSLSSAFLIENVFKNQQISLTSMELKFYLIYRLLFQKLRNIVAPGRKGGDEGRLDSIVYQERTTNVTS